MTRQPHRRTTRGYLAPLTDTSWTYFVSTLIIIIITFGEDLSVAISTPRRQQYYLTLGALTLLMFNTFYQQDLRSSTIEPLYETLPEELQQVDTRTQNLANVGRIPFFEDIVPWNRIKLDTYKVDEKTSDLDRATGHLQMISILQRMAESPNYFAIMAKQDFYANLLQFYKGNNGLSEALPWQWKFSPKVSNWILKGFVAPKYRNWQEPFNYFLLRVTESNLFHPYESFIVTFDHKRNPYRDDDWTIGNKKITQGDDTHSLFMWTIAGLQFTGLVLLAEIVRAKYFTNWVSQKRWKQKWGKSRIGRVLCMSPILIVVSMNIYVSEPKPAIFSKSSCSNKSLTHIF